ncbi:hypothetical protein JD971_05745 [Croceicoccus sp. YJ47]|nr:DUF2231 domain-containing protein [Croceicoccus sp. YJ47]QQN75179.1 hypothetical protein JD971_05745 [Croceicoccus sp. YJ47]
MKRIQFMAIVAASLLFVGPVQAHGDEKHGEETSAAPAAANGDAHDQAAMAQMGDGGAVGEPSAGHDEASGGHDEAGGHADEGDSGVIAVLKKLHPATIHFPIALFLMAAATELFVMRRKGAGLESAVRVLVYGGATGAVIAALFGWIHTGLWFGGDTVMQVHRWNGMLIAVLGIAMAYLASRPSQSRAWLRTAIFSMAALILVQGFLGGELAHGPNHLGISWL